MNQQFTLFNLDKRHYLPKCGNMPELICSNMPPTLVSLLLNPGKSKRSYPDIGAWAGERLVCVGDLMKQYPTGVLTAKEEAEVREYAEGKEDEDGANLYHFARHAFTQAPLPSVNTDQFAGGQQVWVLRNLSKRVYVRADVLAGKPEAMGPFVEPLGFGDLLLANITWSTDSVKMDYGHVLVLGPWAGDRFDIVPWDVAKKDIKKEKKAWKDVSEEQAKRTRMLLADLF
ncbi:hypothetical protein JOM56_008810 [Amanita muscaria]